eukprot:gene15422-18290_t
MERLNLLMGKSQPKDDRPSDLPKSVAVSELNLKRKKGESNRDFKNRVFHTMGEDKKKRSNTYQKRKEFMKEKKSQEKTKKRMAGVEQESDHEETLPPRIVNGQEEKRKRDFKELQDQVKFGEQAPRPPTLVAPKDVLGKKVAPMSDSAKRSYLWQQGDGQSESADGEQAPVAAPLSKKQIAKAQAERNLVAMRSRVMDNYANSKKLKAQRRELKQDDTTKKPAKFYL